MVEAPKAPPAPPPPPAPPLPDAPEGVQLLENPQWLTPAFEKLQQIEAGQDDLKVRFIHYGDSHIASDFWTGVVRRRLQERFGDAGHGFILAGKPWKSYHHLDVDYGVGKRKDWSAERIRVYETGTDGRLGLGGVTIRSEKPGASVWVATEADGPVGQNVGSFEVFYLKQPGGGRADLFLDGKKTGSIDTRGQAHMPGYHTVNAEDGPHRLDLRVRGNGDVRLFGFALERPRSGVVYDSVGINGARHTVPLQWDLAIWKAHIAHRRPDVLVTTYGSNEVGDAMNYAAYAQKVGRMIRIYRKAVPNGACLIIGPPDQARKLTRAQLKDPAFAQAKARAAAQRDKDAWETPAQLEKIRQALRQAAADNRCAFWDSSAAIGGPGTMDLWARSKPPKAYKDRVHMTRDSYEAVANQLHDAFIHAYECHKVQPFKAPSNAPAPDNAP